LQRLVRGGTVDNGFLDRGRGKFRSGLLLAGRFFGGGFLTGILAGGLFGG
jgi:hypothetical protein